MGLAVIPVGAIVVAALAASRAINRHRNGGAPRLPTNPLGLLTIFAWVLALFFAPLTWLALRDWSGLLILLLPIDFGLLLFIFPWWMVRLCVIPLGRPRVAFLLTRLSSVVWDKDLASGPVIAAAWAMLHTKKRDPVFIEKLESRLFGQSSLKGGTILGYALLTAVRGDLATARRLMESIESLSPRVCPWVVRPLAREWVVVDAAERGDWRSVYEHARRRGRRTMLTWLLLGVSANLLGEKYGAGRFRLWVAWFLGFRWRSTWGLLRRGLHAEPVRVQVPSLPGEVEGKDPLQAALRLHVTVLQTPPKALVPEMVRMAGRMWDAALADAALGQRFVARSASLAVVPSSEPLDQLRETVVGDLTALLREAKLPMSLWGEESEILQEVAGTLRDELLEEIESASRALHRRAEERRALPAIDEWRDWLAIREKYEAGGAVGGLELRRLAYSQLHHDVCNFAVWLFNQREEKPIGNAMFSWLLTEAKAVEDADAIDLETRNVNAGCGA